MGKSIKNTRKEHKKGNEKRTINKHYTVKKVIIKLLPVRVSLVSDIKIGEGYGTETRE
jgi:hypothetical protein